MEPKTADRGVTAVVSASETCTDGNKEISASSCDAFLQGFTDVMLTGEHKLKLFYQPGFCLMHQTSRREKEHKVLK